MNMRVPKFIKLNSEEKENKTETHILKKVDCCFQ